jgi:hypothetical protein
MFPLQAGPNGSPPHFVYIVIGYEGIVLYGWRQSLVCRGSAWVYSSLGFSKLVFLQGVSMVDTRYTISDTSLQLRQRCCLLFPEPALNCLKLLLGHSLPGCEVALVCTCQIQDP